MAAGNQDFYIEQGATFMATLFFQDALGAAIDLTGSTFKAQIKKTATSTEVCASFKFELLNQATDMGKVKIFLPAADSAAIQVAPETSFTRHINKFIYDVDRILSDGTIQRVIQGVVSVSPAVTS